MIAVYNTRTYERIAKIIKSGRYNQEELLLDMTDFVDMGTLTQDEFNALLELMEQHPPMSMFSITMDEYGNIKSTNTFLLLYKQISKQVYKADIIEQMVTDFRVTNTLSRDEFKELIALIDEVYYPVFEEEEVPSEEELLKSIAEEVL